MKRSYELTTVLRLDTDDALRENIDQIKGWIEGEDEESKQGEVQRIDTTHFGRRKLAYEIDGQREGFYVIFYFDAEGEILDELDRELRLASTTLRHLIVRSEDD
jgi:small subunit ribosomal protein S6